jgi:hypothetical protein
MTSTTTTSDPVARIDEAFAAVTGRDLVSSAEFADQLLDLLVLVDDTVKPTVEIHLRRCTGRSLVSASEATDALLDIRCQLSAV